MAFQGFDLGDDGSAQAFAVGDPFAVAAIADSGLFGPVPKIATGGHGDGEAALRRVGPFAAFVVPIAEMPGLFHKVAGVGPHAPFVTGSADLGIAIGIVEGHKLAGDGVLVGSYAFTKNSDRRIAITRLEIAKHLVVGAVFLDDVEDVFDRGLIPDMLWDGMIREVLDLFGSRTRDAGIGLGGQVFICASEFGGSGQWDDAEGALQQFADMLPAVVLPFKACIGPCGLGWEISPLPFTA